MGFTSGSAVKNQPVTMEPQRMWVWSLGWEEPLEEGMATHSSILFFFSPVFLSEESHGHAGTDSWTWLKKLSMHTYVMKTSLKVPKIWGSQSFQVSEHNGKVTRPKFLETEAPGFRILWDLTLYISSSSCSSISCIINFNKLQISNPSTEFCEPL